MYRTSILVVALLSVALCASATGLTCSNVAGKKSPVTHTTGWFKFRNTRHVEVGVFVVKTDGSLKLRKTIPAGGTDKIDVMDKQIVIIKDKCGYCIAVYVAVGGKSIDVRIPRRPLTGCGKAPVCAPCQKPSDCASLKCHSQPSGATFCGTRREQKAAGCFTPPPGGKVCDKCRKNSDCRGGKCWGVSSATLFCGTIEQQTRRGCYKKLGGDGSSSDDDSSGSGKGNGKGSDSSDDDSSGSGKGSGKGSDSSDDDSSGGGHKPRGGDGSSDDDSSGGDHKARGGSDSSDDDSSGGRHHHY